MTITPLAYDPSYEVTEKNEDETNRELAETIMKISKKVTEDEHHASRGVHLKSHGILIGEVEVFSNLPDIYAQGIFAKPGKHHAIMRFSAPPGDLLPDSVSTPRGLAVKIMDVAGERLPGSESATTQDFVMVNGPAFQNPDAKSFLRGLKLFAATTDKLGKTKEIISTVMQASEKFIEKLGGESGNIKLMGGEAPNHPLGEAYFTQASVLYGPYMAKISVQPSSEELKKLHGVAVDIKDDPLALRNVIYDHFSRHGGEWKICVQLSTDIDAMPIEDPSVEWPEEQSPYVPVARMTMAAQSSWDDEKAALVDERMSFSPWHGVAAHRPIGRIMRVRKHAYETSVAFRSEHNGVEIAEPSSSAEALRVEAKRSGCPFH